MQLLLSLIVLLLATPSMLRQIMPVATKGIAEKDSPNCFAICLAKIADLDSNQAQLSAAAAEQASVECSQLQKPLHYGAYAL